MLSGLDSIRGVVETHENKLESHEDKLQVIGTDLMSVMSDQAAQTSRLAALENMVKERFNLTENTQHDPYCAAFAKNEEFLKIFCFFVNFGYDTTSGFTCAVFKVINKVPCVCVSLKALHNIAKMLLNSPKIARKGCFPLFSSFRLGHLQETFRLAKLPQCPLTNEIVNKLFERSSVIPLKADRANIINWIALEMKPFVRAVKNQVSSKKLDEMKFVFHENFPTDIKGDMQIMKKITTKDKMTIGVLDSAWNPCEPVFGEAYWRELFYKDMFTYRQMMFPKQSTEEHVHFSSFHTLEPEVELQDFDDLDIPDVAGVHEEEEEDTSTKKRKYASLRETCGEKRPKIVFRQV